MNVLPTPRADRQEQKGQEQQQVQEQQEQHQVQEQQEQQQVLGQLNVRRRSQMPIQSVAQLGGQDAEESETNSEGVTRGVVNISMETPSSVKSRRQNQAQSQQYKVTFTTDSSVGGSSRPSPPHSDPQTDYGIMLAQTPTLNGNALGRHSSLTSRERNSSSSFTWAPQQQTVQVRELKSWNRIINELKSCIQNLELKP
jgi:hypothetical protein